MDNPTTKFLLKKRTILFRILLELSSKLDSILLHVINKS